MLAVVNIGDGDLYTCGSNEVGQLGRKKGDHCTTATRVEALDNFSVQVLPPLLHLLCSSAPFHSISPLKQQKGLGCSGLCALWSYQASSAPVAEIRLLYRLSMFIAHFQESVGINVLPASYSKLVSIQLE